jgi:hypothetical protein
LLYETDYILLGIGVYLVIVACGFDSVYVSDHTGYVVGLMPDGRLIPYLG